MKVFIDLFSGLGGASQAFEDSPDWRVIKIDNNRELIEHNRGLQIMDIGDTEEVIRMIESQFPNGCHLNCEKLVIWASRGSSDYLSRVWHDANSKYWLYRDVGQIPNDRNSNTGFMGSSKVGCKGNSCASTKQQSENTSCSFRRFAFID